VPLPCAAHPGAVAEFRCTACRRALCSDCVETGHRLWFCRHCRERALPLGEPATTTPGGRARRRRLDRPYGFADALRFVFRGGGVFALPAYVLFLVTAAFLPGIVAFAPLALTALVLPGYLFEIVRATADGEEEMPYWPDFSEGWRQAGQWLQVAALALVAALPWLLLRRLVGCDVESFLVPDAGLCALAGAAGGALGLTLGLIGLGAIGSYDAGWLAIRLDLHFEALIFGTRGQAPAFARAIALLLAAALGVTRLVESIPLVSLVVFHAATGYALFTGAHLAGLLFRRHRERLDAIYLR
jgi:hypothetical protein